MNGKEDTASAATVACTMANSAEQQPRIALSVVLPVFSETTALRETVRQVMEKAGNVLHEIIIVIAPKSTQECFDVCHELERGYPYVRLHVQERTPGAGLGVREGFALCTGTHVALLSADGETDPAILPDMLRKIRDTDCDVVTATRWRKGGGFHGYNPVKLVCNYLFQQIFRILYLTRLTDLTFGYRIFRRELVQKIRWEYERHEFFLETMLKPLKLGARTEEVPVQWFARGEGESKNTFWRNFAYFKAGIAILLQSEENILLDHRKTANQPR